MFHPCSYTGQGSSSVDPATIVGLRRVILEDDPTAFDVAESAWTSGDSPFPVVLSISSSLGRPPERTVATLALQPPRGP